MEPLQPFDATFNAWLSERFGVPTDVQAQAWPRIAAGEHLLVTAPTGSGKTLAAFLWALQQLARGAWEPGGVRVLYVSPLKALNNDIHRNLLAPLRELAELHGDAWPGIRAAVRSGDTPESERRRLVREPPEILVTTPESLNLLLASSRARRILTGVRTVILDEIHAVAGSKRGSYLMLAVERVAELSGEFQRVALSATVRPLETVAAFVGGFRPEGGPRPVGLVVSATPKRLSVAVLGATGVVEGSVWPPLVEAFRERLERNRATLFFVNNRALCERLVNWLNEGRESPVAYGHHGSLSRELRELVEAKLKAGELKALVATSSLELGIDIGDLDEVVLVQSPRTLNSAIQRVGRAGHRVGEVSRGRIHPTHGRDALDAAVLAPLIEERAVEAIRPVRNPLDVLGQVLVALCVTDARHPDDMFALVRTCWSFRTLQRAAFDRVIAMLRGRYADSRIRHLKSRLLEDPATGLLRATEGARMLVFRSGGVIPDRGYFTLRVQGGGARLGELDEEFVWERRIGDEFHIGAQVWRVARITRNEVEVVPGSRADAGAPFWRAEAQARDFELCDSIGTFLQESEPRLDDPGFATALERDHRLDAAAAGAVIDLLKRQRKSTGRLPHRQRIVVETCRESTRGGESLLVVLHACWGARVLRPLALALAAAWEERTGAELETFNNDDCILLHVPAEYEISSILQLVRPDNVEELVRRRLENSGFFGARFRENCQRALLLPRGGPGMRMPLWLNRLRAQRLLGATARYRDFPMRAETWRTCLEDEFDIERLRLQLEQVFAGAIEVKEVRTTHPSPFAENVAWRSTNLFMYEQDKGVKGPAASLSEEVLREVLHDAALRPRLERELIDEFQAKLQRTMPGYRPDDPSDWLDHIEECLLVRPARLPADEPLSPGLEQVAWGGGWVISRGQRSRIERAREGDDRALTGCLAEYLRSRGPVTLATLAGDWAVPEERVRASLAALVEEDLVVADRLGEGAGETEFCDRENLERLLRIRRARRRAAFTALRIGQLPRFLATFQGLADRGAGEEDLPSRMEVLLGYPAGAALWEEAILPARLQGYRGAWLNRLLGESDLLWLGSEKERVCFAFPEDARLLLEPCTDPPPGWPDARGSYGLHDLAAQGERGSSAEWTRRLWGLFWEGRVVSDSFGALRRGVAHRFEPEQARPGRGAFRSWKSSRPLLGHWRAMLRSPPADRLEGAEQELQRARLLLARYGVLFRELCGAELPSLRWGGLLRALRRLELSGEVLAGHFFEGLTGLQFCSHDAFRLLRSLGERDAAPCWLNAQDPASVCGLGLIEGLPARVASNWLVYRGADLVLVVRRGGREIECRATPLPGDLALFREQLAREFRPPSRIVVELIDGAPAVGSRFTEVFRAAGFFKDRGALVLERSYGEDT